MASSQALRIEVNMPPHVTKESHVEALALLDGNIHDELFLDITAPDLTFGIAPFYSGIKRHLTGGTKILTIRSWSPFSEGRDDIPSEFRCLSAVLRDSTVRQLNIVIEAKREWDRTYSLGWWMYLRWVASLISNTPQLTFFSISSPVLPLTLTLLFREALATKPIKAVRIFLESLQPALELVDGLPQVEILVIKSLKFIEAQEDRERHFALVKKCLKLPKLQFIYVTPQPFMSRIFANVSHGPYKDEEWQEFVDLFQSKEYTRFLRKAVLYLDNTNKEQMKALVNAVVDHPSLLVMKVNHPVDGIQSAAIERLEGSMNLITLRKNHAESKRMLRFLLNEKQKQTSKLSLLPVELIRMICSFLPDRWVPGYHEMRSPPDSVLYLRPSDIFGEGIHETPIHVFEEGNPPVLRSIVDTTRPTKWTTRISE